MRHPLKSLRPLVLPLALAGCATVGGATSSHGRIAALPVESDAFPKVAQAINARLRDEQTRRGATYSVSRVPLEVVQLSIECVEPKPECYAAVGHSFNADRIVWAQLVPGKQGLSVSVTMFDVATQAPLHVAQRNFGGSDEAVGAVGGLVDEALAAGGPAGAPPAP